MRGRLTGASSRSYPDEGPDQLSSMTSAPLLEPTLRRSYLRDLLARRGRDAHEPPPATASRPCAGRSRSARKNHHAGGSMTAPMGVGILGMGSCLPPTIRDNDFWPSTFAPADAGRRSKDF